MLTSPFLTTDLAVREAHSEDASGLIGVPDAVARPANEAEVADLIRDAAEREIAVTPQGLRSSTVGSPLAMGGIALSLEKMDRIVDIDVERRRAIVEPGVNLGTFKAAVRDAGLFFPPDPTSENECCVGGAVMTNASGARSLIYGSTRRWIRGIRLVLGDGRITEIQRSDTSKNTVGYFGFQNPIDLIVGSEGTLGVATLITVDLLPAPAGYLAGMAFFPSLGAAIGFVRAAVGSDTIHPRCLELFDDGSLEMIRPGAGRLGIPAEARAGIFFEEECRPEDADDVLLRWHGVVDAAGGLADDTIVATNEARQDEFRRLRHILPSTMNERGRAARANGGLKVGTDWAVPLHRLPEMIEEATRLADQAFGGYYIRYGHVGNGHPHFNMVAEDSESLMRARAAAHAMCLKAVELGGTVTAEHGVGKVKRDYVTMQYPSWVIDAMRAVKRTLDPKGILAPGNIFV